MSAPHTMLPLCHLTVKNDQNWWKFDEVLTKTNLQFSETRCMSKNRGCLCITS